MTTAASLVRTVEALGGRLIPDGDAIEVEAPPGTLSGEIIEDLRAHKAELLALLRHRRPSRVWDAPDWREYFEERVAVAMIDGQQPETEARRIAWECCIIRWRDLNPVASEPSHCAHCGRPDEPGNIVPFGIGPHVWLHSACWRPWDRGRREEAIQALRKLVGAATHG